MPGTGKLTLQDSLVSGHAQLITSFMDEAGGLTIAHIRRELGRHRWIEGYMEVRALKDSKREVLKCRNCAKIHYATQSDPPPVTGCISDIDLGRMGKAMQADQLERDFRGGLYQR